MPKLLICDWDGTIADSVTQIVACKTYLAIKYQLPIPTKAMIRNVLGQDFKQAMATCFPSATSPQFQELCNSFHCSMQTPQFQAALFPSVLEALSELKREGCKLAVATSKSRAELDQALSVLHLTDLFDVTCCAEEAESKPSPAMLYKICKRLAIPDSSCIMIGDTISDILCAKNAGMKIMCVTFGAQSRETLAEFLPDAFIDHWLELPAKLSVLSWN